MEVAELGAFTRGLPHVPQFAPHPNVAEHPPAGRPPPTAPSAWRPARRHPNAAAHARAAGAAASGSRVCASTGVARASDFAFLATFRATISCPERIGPGCPYQEPFGDLQNDRASMDARFTGFELR